jgi:predicted RNase H-like nuclease (RuvC/YqgF family)
MSSLPTSAIIDILQQGLTEINNLNKRITASKQLKEKNTNPNEADELDLLIQKYVNTKAEIVEKYRNQLKELDKAIEAKQTALARQRNQLRSITAELAVEESVGEDQSKISNLKSSFSSTKDILEQLNQENARLEDTKTKFLDAIEMHGFDRVNLTPPYEVTGMKSGSRCPKCKSQDTVYLDKNSPNPKTKCLTCGNIWKI